MKVAVSYQVLELAAISQVQICWELKLRITRVKENSFLTVEKLAFTISSRLNQYRLKGFSVKLRKAWTFWSILIGQLRTNQSQERARHLDGFIQYNIILLFTVFKFNIDESSSKEISQSRIRKLISFWKHILLKLNNVIVVEPLRNFEPLP